MRREWRRPLANCLGAVPNVGQRLAILGEIPCFAPMHLPDDGYADDDVRRVSPTTVWRSSLLNALKTHAHLSNGS